MGDARLLFDDYAHPQQDQRDRPVVVPMGQRRQRFKDHDRKEVRDPAFALLAHGAERWVGRADGEGIVVRV